MFIKQKTKKKIFIHIGHGKTGSTSIQKFLSDQSINNNEINFYYPKSSFSGEGHHLLFKSDKNTFQCLLNEIKKTSKQNIIISSEHGLPNFRHFIKNQRYKVDFFKTLAKKFDTKIIYYVRNHFDQLESSFLQYLKTSKPSLYSELIDTNADNEKFYSLLKLYFFPKNTSPSSWTDIVPTRQFYYYENIEFWSKIFGKKNIITKVYHKNNLKENDIVSDFIHLIDPDNNFLKKDNNNTFFSNKTNAYTYNKKGFLISNETALLIKQAFMKSNILYSKKYLDDNNTNFLMKNFN